MERSIALIALFAALIGALALLPGLTLGFGVPITAQTLGVMLCGTVLGARKGALAVLLYLLLIAIGLPIAANGGAGLGVFARPSVGYLVGFPVGAFVIGLVSSRFANPMGFWPATLAALVGGLVVINVFGIIGMWIKLDVTLPVAIGYAAPFMPGDVIKAVAAGAITAALWKARPGLAAQRG
ncbi:biotin transporter BioY [Ruixingdingia sedimenti]|uniref:Biotin transporter n=1 Tax=Ruixingdingia sedimenti TaxID=3073604 RepID=A0ABU1F5N9_9RHOB|nr:biotin transporter BioY [Xinfangfangia sp. LG-4]MDR5652176.1 biotin transporter BioY [Xinfangfangia sp. LG-4]